MTTTIKEVQPKEYFDVIDLWKTQVNFNLPDEVNPLFSNPAILVFLNNVPFASYIFDIGSQEFRFVSDNIIGYFGHHAGTFSRGELELKNKVVHPVDLPNIWKFFKIYWQHVNLIPSIERAKYKFNFDYRIVKPGGEEARILEQVIIFQQDLIGNITHILGTCTDITGWKKSGEQLTTLSSTIDDKVILLKPEGDKSINSQVFLSRREIEIVKLLSQGNSSKCIADKLHISFNTVNTHRQHIIKKTNTKNTGELVQFAAGVGMI
ncbi:hypothetical protein BH23BAC1_BH23BAC1_42910 [soil metagenome]